MPFIALGAVYLMKIYGGLPGNKPMSLESIWIEGFI
jgi:hypothetical protein